MDVMNLNWISLQPRIPTLVYKLWQSIGATFDPTIIQEGTALETLCKMTFPTATVINLKTSQFLKILMYSKVKPVGRYTVSTYIYKDINTVPIFNPSFNIWGFDITLKISLGLNFIKQLHPELQQSLCIIKKLACDRGLK